MWRSAALAERPRTAVGRVGGGLEIGSKLTQRPCGAQPFEAVAMRGRAAALGAGPRQPRDRSHRLRVHGCDHSARATMKRASVRRRR